MDRFIAKSGKEKLPLDIPAIRAKAIFPDISLDGRYPMGNLLLSNLAKSNFPKSDLDQEFQHRR